VEPALHRLDAHPDRLRHLRGREPFHVPQQQDLPVHGIELGDGLLERALHLPAGESLVGRASGVGDLEHLPPGALGVHRLLVLGGELGASPLLDAEAPRDGVEPGRGRRRPPEILHGPCGGDQRLLEHVLRRLRVPAHLEAEPVDLPLVALQESLERGPVARAGAVHQLLVGEGRGLGHG